VYGGEKYSYGINQFRENMRDILDLAGKKKVPVFLGDLVSNVKDIHPFGDAGEEDQSAFFNYAAAQHALAEGDTALATTLFYTAKDLDPVRFRASEEINQIIETLASEKGATLVPVKRSFSEASPGGMIGNNLLTEHVHPNIDGQFLMAQSFFEKIIASKLIGESPDPLTEKPEAYYRGRWGYTALDSLMADFRVRQLKSYWPYQTLDAEVRFRDVFKPEGMLEEMAFSVITDPDATAESLHDRLGDYYENNGAYAKALKEYNALVTINPNWPDYLNKAANSYFNLNDLYAAEQYLRESMKFEGSYFSFSMLGEIAFIKHDYQQALHLFEQAYQHLDEASLGAEGRIFLLSRLHYLYFKFNQTARMQEMAIQLARLGQQPETPREDLPFTYSEYVPYDIESDFFRAVDLAAKDIDSSLFYLKRCLAINDCPVVNLYIGDVLYQKQDLDALHYYRKAYEAYDRDPGYLTRLFYAYFVNVNKAGAKAALDKLMAVDPSYPEISRLQTLLSALQ
jgi:tetratricopeptide (TPR) repeat protein